MSLHEDVAKLIELQNIDLEVRRLEDTIAAGQTELDRRRQRIEDYRAEIEEMSERRERCIARRKELEEAIEEEFARIKDRQAKIMNVQTSREYQSLLKEIEDGKEANRQREDEAVLLLEEVESVDKKLAEMRNLLEAEEKLLAEKEAEVAAEAERVRAEKEKIQKKRVAKAKKVPAAVLRRY
ncbi:MAG TPA: hypothetical protein ENJ73_03070, partial [Desulfobacterales bacterium]|nr:hypothetical protein [Desulfobacterales bacterium]